MFGHLVVSIPYLPVHLPEAWQAGLRVNLMEGSYVAYLQNIKNYTGTRKDSRTSGGCLSASGERKILNMP